ncbi:MAG TPA: 1,2-phenylacetyl-CoA epoxidase subunit PaaD [Candidatus Limnocylindrales bacterium]|nr:1,2-phenylacetyl-CoA epoxidase subunit PaaD [Candidatus Limnocylindrales bacterium]
MSAPSRASSAEPAGSAAREAAGLRRLPGSGRGLRRPLESAVWAALQDVHDPEIPAISVVDLGVVRSVQAAPGRVRVELLPTFVGCPAIGVMREAVLERLDDFADEVEVEITFAEPWTSERITPEGRRRLRESGFAPPVAGADDDRALPVLPVAECPYCGSRNTSLENAFGPTLCRAIYHCRSCTQPFEQFKAV